MNKTPTLLGVLLLTSTLVAQVPEPPPPPAQDPKPEATAEQRMMDLQQEYQAIVQKWREEQQRRAREAEEAPPGEAVPAISMRPPLDPIPAKALKIAKDYAGTDDAVQFLVFSLQLGMQFDKDTANAALKALAESHAEHEAVVEMVQHLGEISSALGEEPVAEASAILVKQNPKLAGWIAVATLGPIIDDADLDSAEYKEARAQLAKLAEASAETDPALQGAIDSRINLRERLGVGGQAPDIVGVDLDGTDFKLSDYRGKVVFLDFWGDW